MRNYTKENTDYDNWTRTEQPQPNIARVLAGSGQRSVVGAPIGLKSSFSAEHFPATRKDESRLEPALSRVSRNVRSSPWLAHRAHMMKRASVIGQFTRLLSHFSFPPPFSSCLPGVVCSVCFVPSRKLRGFASRFARVLRFFLRPLLLIICMF